MIPRRIHLWWHLTPAPDFVTSAVSAWQRMHPDWDVRLWSDEQPVRNAIVSALTSSPRVLTEDHARHLSNLVRYRLLHDLGGVWVDCDTAPLRPLDELMTDAPFCASLAGSALTHVMGGPAGHRLWSDMIAATQTGGRGGSCPAVSGSRVFASVARSHDDLVLHEPGRFLDMSADGRPVGLPRDGKRFATHSWATSSQRLAGHD